MIYKTCPTPLRNLSQILVDITILEADKGSSVLNVFYLEMRLSGSGGQKAELNGSILKVTTPGARHNLSPILLPRLVLAE